MLFEQSGGRAADAVALLLPVQAAGGVRAGACALGHRANDALKAALALAQGGEFGFVLLSLSGSLQLLPPALEQAAIAGILVSMLVAPFLIQYADRIAKRLIKQDWALAGRGPAPDPGTDHEQEASTSSSAVTAVAASIWRVCWIAKTSLFLRSTSTPSACARPARLVTRWYLATPPNAKY